MGKKHLRGLRPREPPQPIGNQCVWSSFSVSVHCHMPKNLAKKRAQPPIPKLFLFFYNPKAVVYCDACPSGCKTRRVVMHVTQPVWLMTQSVVVLLCACCFCVVNHAAPASLSCCGAADGEGFAAARSVRVGNKATKTRVNLHHAGRWLRETAAVVQPWIFRCRMKGLMGKRAESAAALASLVAEFTLAT